MPSVEFRPTGGIRQAASEGRGFKTRSGMAAGHPRNHSVNLRDPYLTRALLADSLEAQEKNGSSGRTRTYNPPVNSLVGCSKFNNFAAQMTTHGDVEIRKVTNIVTLI